MATLLWVPTATAANSYDGTYRGEVTRTRGDDTICGKSGYHTAYTVVNGKFSVVYDIVHHIGVNVVVADDGSFQGSQTYMAVGSHTTTQLRVTGRIVGNVLDGQIDGMACTRHFHLTRS